MNPRDIGTHWTSEDGKLSLWLHPGTASVIKASRVMSWLNDAVQTIDDKFSYLDTAFFYLEGFVLDYVAHDESTALAEYLSKRTPYNIARNYELFLHTLNNMDAIVIIEAYTATRPQSNDDVPVNSEKKDGTTSTNGEKLTENDKSATNVVSFELTG